MNQFLVNKVIALLSFVRMRAYCSDVVILVPRATRLNL